MKVTLHNHRCLITECNSEELYLVENECKIVYKRWNGRRYDYQGTHNSFDSTDKSFPRALLWHIGDLLDKKGYDIECNDLTTPTYGTVKMHSKLPPPRENQKDFHAKMKQDEEGIGLIISTTGSGKSWMIADVIEDKRVYTLVIAATRVNRDGLAASLADVFGQKNVSTTLPGSSQVFGKKKDLIRRKKSNYLKEQLEEKLETPEASYLIHSGFRPSQRGWYKTKGRLKEKFGRSETITMCPIYVICAESIPLLPKEFIDQFEMILVDEGHKYSEELSHLLDQAENAYWRYFFSATMWRDRDEDMRRLLSISSNRIIFEEVPMSSMERGVVAEVKFEQIRSPKPIDPAGEWVLGRDGQYKIDFDRDPDSIFKKGIICNVSRNTEIINKAIDRYHENKVVLIAVEEEAHGHILKQRIEEKHPGVPVYTYYGMLGKNEKAIIQELASTTEDPLIIISTYALSIAADTKKVDCVILADARKSTIKNSQRIGRSLRLKEDGHESEVFYFYDWFHPTLEKHSQEIWKMIKQIYQTKDSYAEKRFNKVKSKVMRL